MGLHTRIECDECQGAMIFNGISTKKTVILVARTKGWSVGKKILCPTCRNKKKVVE